MSELEGHGGAHIVAAARAYGVETLFTLSGAHIFPLYDAAIGGQAGTFFFAEEYHQQYLAKNPNGYCGLGGTGVTCPIGTGVAA